MNNLFYCYLVCIAIQDMRWYYFSYRWLVPSICVGIIWGLGYGYQWENIICALFFGLPVFIAYKKKGMGSADVAFVSFFSFLLGIERMLVAMIIATLIGIVWSLIKKERYVPFVSCLAIGVFIALWKGYTIYSHILFHLRSLGA